MAFVRGLQGDNPKYWLTASLLKHFMANSNEDNRDSSSSNFDPRLMQEYYSVPFRMAIEQGGADAYMASYNAVNEIPMTASPLLKNLTMKQWGFNGMIDTDRGAVTYMVTKHKYYSSMDEAVAGAIHAGINQFLNDYRTPLEEALQKRLITEAEIDRNLRGVFRVLIRLGLLDPPATVPYSNIRAHGGTAPWNQAASRELALRITRESIVLLKNSHDLLPFDLTKIKSIAVLGPRADEVDSDFYGGTPPFAVTPLQGIRNKVGDKAEVRYSANRETALQMARDSDVAVVLIGNQPTCGTKFGSCPDPSEGKEAIDRRQINLNPEQEKLIQDVYAANPRTVAVLISGFPYAIDWTEQHVPAILHMAHSSEEEGNALADVLFGDYDPAGRLAVTWPQSVDQLPPMMNYNIRDGRTYMYFKDKPLYPFGYGMSYTKFKYAHMHLSARSLSPVGKITVSTEVTNTGSRAGDEVVQMYVQYVDSKVNRPLEELKGFERITLKPRQMKTVQFQLSAKALAYWDDQKSKWTVEQDRVRVMIGSSSSQIKEKREVMVGQ